VDKNGLFWLTSGKFTDTPSFGLRKTISFNSENFATFCDSYSNSRIASCDKNDADYPDFNIVASCCTPWNTARQSGCLPYRVLPVQPVGWSSLDSYLTAFSVFLIATDSVIVVILYCGKHDRYDTYWIHTNSTWIFIAPLVRSQRLVFHEFVILYMVTVGIPIRLNVFLCQENIIVQRVYSRRNCGAYLRTSTK